MHKRYITNNYILDKNASITVDFLVKLYIMNHVSVTVNVYGQYVSLCIGVRMATIKDIAKMTGYSTGTVSRVLNNKADVSAKARASIEKAIKDLGFQPNANAQMLKQAISSGVYVIVRGMNNRFLVSLLEKIQGRLIEHGVSTGVFFLNEMDN